MPLLSEEEKQKYIDQTLGSMPLLSEEEKQKYIDQTLGSMLPPGRVQGAGSSLIPSLPATGTPLDAPPDQGPSTIPGWIAEVISQPFKVFHPEIVMREIESILPAVDYLQKPAAAITNFGYHLGTRQFSQETREKFPGAIRKVLFYGVPESGKRFESFEDAIKKGWSGQDRTSMAKAAQAIVWGEKTSDSAEAWMDRHWHTKLAWSANELVSDIVMDAAIDFGIAKGLYRPGKLLVEKGLLKFPWSKGRLYAEWFGPVMPLELRKGFNEFIVRGINDAAGLKATARNTIEDLAAYSMRTGDIKVPLVFVANADDVSRAMQVAIKADAVVNRTNVLIAGHQDDLGKLYKQLDKMDVRPVAANRYDDLWDNVYNTKQTLISDIKNAKGEIDNLATTLTKQMGEADAAKSAYREMIKRGRTIDYQGVHRLMKESYIEKYTAVYGRQQGNLLDKVDDFIKVVSNGQAKNVGELTDDQLQILLEFIDVAAKDPRAFRYLSEGMGGFMGPVRRIGRRVFYNQVFSPSWQVFERLGAKRIYQFVDDSWYNRYSHVHNKIFGWEQHLAFIGGKKNKEAMRRVFLLADDALDTTDDALRYTDKFTNESIVFPSAAVLGNEQRAAQFVNDTARELADMALSQGRLSFTGKDAPKVIKNYVTHLFESGARRTSIQYYDDIGKAIGMEGDKLKGLAIADPKKYDDLISDAILDNPAVEKAITEANRRAYTDLSGIANIYKYNIKTKVDIPEFMKRVGLRKGMIEDADQAFRVMLNHETSALYMEPAYKLAAKMARETGNSNVVSYTKNWINGLRGVPGTNEAAIEPFFHDLDILLEYGTDFMRKYTHIPVQHKAQNQAVRRFSQWIRAKTYGAAMGFNPGPVITNMTQSLLTNAAIGTKYTMRGFESLAYDGGQAALKHCRVLVGRNPMSTLSLKQLSKYSQAGGWSFRQVDRWMNCAPAFNGALWKQIVDNPKNLKMLEKYGNVASASGKWRAISNALEDGAFTSEKLLADHIVKLTQYSYLPHDLPRYLQGPIGKAIGQFSTWPANYWTSYLPEMAKMLTGKSVLNIMPWDRAAIFKHILFAEALLVVGRQAGLNLEKHSPIAGGIVGTVMRGYPLPGGPLPRKPGIIKVLEGAAQVALAGDDKRARSEGIWKVQSGLMIGPHSTDIKFIPFYPQPLRRAEKTYESEDLRDMFFLTDKEASRQSVPGGFSGLGGVKGF